MTDQLIVTDRGADYLRYRTEALAREQREADLRPANKTALFDALADASITTVIVVFDGAGDSGQIESIDAQGAQGDVALPTTLIDYAQVGWAKPRTEAGIEADIETVSMSVRDTIETLAYDLLRWSHSGWEINEGAYGEFTFDVATRTIRLEYNERVLETEFSEHEF